MKALKSSEGHQSRSGLHLTHDQGPQQGKSFNFLKKNNKTKQKAQVSSAALSSSMERD